MRTLVRYALAFTVTALAGNTTPATAQNPSISVNWLTGSLYLV